MLTLLGTLVAAEPAPRSAEVAGPMLAALLAGMVMAAIRWPRLALAGSAAAVGVYHLADFPAIGLAWPLAIVLYLAAAAGSALLAGGVMTVLLAGAVIWRLFVENHPLLVIADGLAREAGLVAIAVLLGEVVHRRAAWRREVERWFADRQRQREAELQHEADSLSPARCMTRWPTPSPWLASRQMSPPRSCAWATPTRQRRRSTSYVVRTSERCKSFGPPWCCSAAMSAARRLAQLTDREREIVRLIATGMSNQEIADALHISHAAAKTHVSRALTKTGARDRAQLVVLAYEANLVGPGAIQARGERQGPTSSPSVSLVRRGPGASRR
jgi:DNA-binding CsgD family transcriptional regulator